jgi:hypothetical protein
MFIHHLSNFRQKIDRVLSTGLVARVQAARLELTGVLLGLASKQTFHWMMRVRKCNSVPRGGSSKKFPDIPVSLARARLSEECTERIQAVERMCF